VAGQENGNTYISAQSPMPKKNEPKGFFACEKFLTKAIESKSGLFQFVAPSKTGDNSHISKRSIIGQLMHAYETSGNDLRIGGRYQIKNIIPMERVDLDGGVTSDKSHFMLVVEDRMPNSTGEKSLTSIVLTQARVEFKNKLLSTTGIQAASTLMDEHNLRSGKKTRNRPDSMIVSHAGIGRSATLIVYREILGRLLNGSITDTDHLEREVINLIEQGRNVRGPKFVHSDEQIRELVKALQEKLPNEKRLEKPLLNKQRIVPPNTIDEAPDSPKPIVSRRLEPKAVTGGINNLTPQPQLYSQSKTTMSLAEKIEEKVISRLTEIRQQPSETLVAPSDSVKDAHAGNDFSIAMKLQSRNVGSIRTASGKAFRSSHFKLRDNNGGGNCLFHAIAGTKNKPSLSDTEMDALRNRVAKILEDKPDDPDKSDLNYHDYCLTMFSGTNPPSDRFGRPVFINIDKTVTHHVSNAMMAEAQRMAGNIAGDREIAQWLELPENRHKTVVVVDELAGNESIVTFKDSKREAWKFGNQHPPLTKDEAVERIRASIATAVNEEERGVKPADRTQLALFRSQGHWQAIIGINDKKAAERSVQEHRDDIKRQIELAKVTDFRTL
jgi:hypothetical protein